MHLAAYQAVNNIVRNLGLDSQPLEALDLAGRMVNGSTHELFSGATWTILDLVDDASVDIVADATTWEPDRSWDLVQSTEGLEHIEDWPGLVKTAYKALRVDGWFIMTCASTGRPAHSVEGSANVPKDQHYGNVSEHAFRAVAESMFTEVNTWFDSIHCDLYAWCRK
jgi:predicted SAM-dependent methyltransferase